MWVPLYRPKVGIALFVLSFGADLILHADAYLAAGVFIAVLLWAVYGKGKPPAPEPEPVPGSQAGFLVPPEYMQQIMAEHRAAVERLRMMPEPPPPPLRVRLRRLPRRARGRIGWALYGVAMKIEPWLPKDE